MSQWLLLRRQLLRSIPEIGRRRQKGNDGGRDQKPFAALHRSGHRCEESEYFSRNKLYQLAGIVIAHYRLARRRFTSSAPWRWHACVGRNGRLVGDPLRG